MRSAKLRVFWFRNAALFVCEYSREFNSLRMLLGLIFELLVVDKETLGAAETVARSSWEVRTYTCEKSEVGAPYDPACVHTTNK